MKEIKTNNKEMSPEDMKKSTVLVNVLIITVGIILLIIVLIGWYGESKYSKECTYTTAILVDTKEDSYQWVSSRGGRVQTGYEYFRTYEYTDEAGETCRFTIKMSDSDSSKYLEVDVRYKDNNPDTLQFNIGQLQDRYADAWVFYNNNFNLIIRR